MPRQKKPYLRIRYQKKFIFFLILLGLSTSLLAGLGIGLFSLSLNRVAEINSPSDKEESMKILNYFLRLIPRPMQGGRNTYLAPSPTVSSSPSFPLPSLSPFPTLAAQDPLSAEKEIAPLLQQLKAAGLRTSAVETLVLEGKKEQEAGEEQKALKLFRQAYTLAQELLLVQQYYQSP